MDQPERLVIDFIYALAEWRRDLLLRLTCGDAAFSRISA
jgi:hypothetical protein